MHVKQMKNQQSPMQKSDHRCISSQRSVNQFINLLHVQEKKEEEVKATTYNKNKYNIVLSHAVFEVDRS